MQTLALFHAIELTKIDVPSSAARKSKVLCLRSTIQSTSYKNKNQIKLNALKINSSPFSLDAPPASPDGSRSVRVGSLSPE